MPSTLASPTTTRIHLAALALCAWIPAQAISAHQAGYPDGPPADATRVGTGWFKGQLHTHSDQSDGDDTPEEVANWYKDHNYDFLVLSDHTRVTPFEHFSEPGFLAMEGDEISCCSNHVNAYKVEEYIPGGTIQTNLNRVKAVDGVAILNHPTGLYHLKHGDLMQGGPLLRIMEIYNSNPVHAGPEDEALWDLLLSSGRPVLGVATDDMHSIDTNQAGKAWIVVKGTELTEDAIMDAIEGGEMYASTGVFLDEYTVDDERMFVDTFAADEIHFIGRGGRVLKVVEGPVAEYEFVGNEGYVRAKAFQDGNKWAWMQPVFIGDARQDKFANQLKGWAPMLNDPPLQTLGAPYEGPLASDPEGIYASTTPPGGHFDIDMGAGQEIFDREGDDLYVEELDDEDGFDDPDAYDVSVSSDGTEWIYIGEGVGDSSFDFRGLIDFARYIRVEATSELGIEIDGVIGNYDDAYVDHIVDWSGLGLGHPRYAVGPLALGELERPATDFAVEILQSGHITLDLGAGEEVVDGEGLDVYVSELSGSGEYRLLGSQNGTHWTSLGDRQGSGALDLDNTMKWIRYFRVEALGSSILLDGVWAQNVTASTDIEVEISPDGSTRVGVDGGAIEFTMTVSNTGTENHNIVAWVEALSSTGETQEDMIGPVEFVLGPGESASRSLSMDVPGFAPAGDHLLTGLVTDSLESPVTAVDSFFFQKDAE